ncbi:MAG: PepSY domain-containing protein [Acidobacteriota bacterium]|nr:MAG: PepSY domain-containing protein [Acidobacteriota bacterium]
MTKKVNAMLIGMLAVVVAAGGAFVISAQSGKDNERQDEKIKYRSSIQVADDKNEKEESEEANESSEDDEANETGEKGEANESEVEDQAEVAESARLQSMATITPEQAKSAALAQVPGTVVKVELENEDGNVVYGVEIKTADGEHDVKVDAGNGKVLHAEKGDGEDDDND